jgi:hypothetical protein
MIIGYPHPLKVPMQIVQDTYVSLDVMKERRKERVAKFLSVVKEGLKSENETQAAILKTGIQSRRFCPWSIDLILT